MSETTQAATPQASTDFTQPQQVTDSKGRRLTVQKLDLVKEMDLMEAAGDAADIRRYWVNALFAATVIEIDGVPRPFPTTKQMLRDQVRVVGIEGLNALFSAMSNSDEPASGAQDNTAKN